MRFRFAWLILAILSLTSLMPGQEKSSRLKIEWPTQRWEAMDKAISDVFVGPNGKVWYQIGPCGEPRSFAEVRDHLEQEFKQPTPQFSGAVLALLDQRGTAWFYVDKFQRLVGYDGQRWIERPAASGCRFTGDCPTAGRLSDEYANQTSPDAAWFIDQGGVHRFDGQNWTYRELGKFKPGENRLLRLAVSTRGHYAVAAGGQGVSIFQDGKWSQLTDFPLFYAEPLRPDTRSQRPQNPWWYAEHFVVTDAGVCWFSKYHGLGSLRINPDSDRIAALVKQLGAEMFEVREQATIELMGLGKEITPQLEEERQKTTDAEVRQRINRILTAFSSPRNKCKGVFADCEIFGGIMGIYQDIRGRVFLPAENIQPVGKPKGSYVVILHPDGHRELLSADDQLFAWRRYYAGQLPPLLSSDGNGVWLEYRGSNRNPGLYGFKKQSIVSELAGASLRCTLAVGPKNQLIISSGRPISGGGVSGLGASQIMVFSPEIAEDRTALEVVTVPWEPESTLVADDGSIWAFRKDKENERLVRFDGQGWTALPVKKKNAGVLPRVYRGQFLAAGRNGAVIAEDNGDFLLYEKEVLVATSSSLKQLISEQRPFIAANFKNTISSNYWSDHAVHLVTDAAENIWLRHDFHLDVLRGNKWISGLEGLKVAGSKSGLAGMLLPICDGTKVFVTDGNVSGSNSYLGEVQDGQLKFSEISDHSVGYERFLYDREGKLWLPNCYYTNGEASGIRLTQSGIADIPETDGWPLLQDKSGNVWLDAFAGDWKERFDIWQNGKKVQSIERTTSSEIRAAFSDAPGSVYLWTVRGFEHFVAEGPKHDRFQQDKIYMVSGIGGSQTHAAYSNLGYFVIANYTDDPQRRFHLQMIKLPKPKPASQPAKNE